MKLDGLTHELENDFLYELQHIPIYGNSNYSGTAAYFSEFSIKALFEKAHNILENDLNASLGGDIERIPPPLENIFVLKTAVLALKTFVEDARNEKIAKPRMIFNDNESELKKSADSLDNLADDYEKLYQELLEEIKKKINYELFAIQKPEVKDDETLIARVGSEGRPATQKDIEEVQMALAQVKRDEKLTLVTHHLVNFVVVKTRDMKKATVQGI